MTFEIFDPRVKLPRCTRLRGMNLIGIDMREWKSGTESTMISAICKVCFEDAFVGRLMFGHLKISDKSFFDKELELKSESILEVYSNLWLQAAEHSDNHRYQLADNISGRCRNSFRAPVNVFFIKYSYKDQIDKIVDSLEQQYVMEILKNGTNDRRDWNHDFYMDSKTITYTVLYNYLKTIA